MAFPLIAAVSPSTKTDSTIFKIDREVGFRRNQLLIAVIGKSGSSAVLAPGWEAVKSASSETHHCAIFRRIVKRDDPISYVFTSPMADNWTGYIYAFNLYSLALPVNDADIDISLTAPQIVTKSPDSLVLTGLVADKDDKPLDLAIFQTDFNLSVFGNRASVGMIGGHVTAKNQGIYGPYLHKRAAEGNSIAWTIAITSDEFFGARYKWEPIFPFDDTIILGLRLSGAEHNNYLESEDYLTRVIQARVTGGSTAIQLDEDTWEIQNPGLPFPYLWKRSRL